MIGRTIAQPNHQPAGIIPAIEAPRIVGNDANAANGGVGGAAHAGGAGVAAVAGAGDSGVVVRAGTNALAAMSRFKVTVSIDR